MGWGCAFVSVRPNSLIGPEMRPEKSYPGQRQPAFEGGDLTSIIENRHRRQRLRGCQSHLDFDSGIYKCVRNRFLTQVITKSFHCNTYEYKYYI